jgi:cell division protein FtsQ
VGGRQVPVYYDRKGVVFNIGGEASGGAGLISGDLPVISGLVIEDPRPGMQLPAAFIPLLEQLDQIRQNAPELLSAVSEIRINRKPYDGFNLILYPVHKPIRVRLEKDLSEETLRYVLLMLDVFDKAGGYPEEIDFRSGIGSFSVKEAPSGE